MASIHVSKLLPAIACLALSGCPDPDGNLDEFVERTEPFRPGGERFPMGPEAVGFFDASGTYLLGIAASVGPDQPLLFEAVVMVDGDPPMISLALTAVTANPERTLVGDTLVTDPVPLDVDEGTFTVDFGRVFIDGSADPIIPGAPIEADLVLNGQTQSETEICGTVAGAIITPAALPLEGTFGTTVGMASDFASLTVSAKCGGGGDGAGVAGGEGGMGAGGEGGMGAGGMGGEGGMGAGGEGGMGAGGEGGMGAGGEGGMGEGGEGGGGDPECVTECDRLADCAAGDDLCPGINAENRDAVAAGCVEACNGNPLLLTITRGQAECEGLVTTVSGVSPDFSASCAGE